MPELARPLMALTAEDLMTRTLVQVPEELPLREAASLLLKNQVGGAPVVDREGRCVGVLSAFDFLRLAARRVDASSPTPSPQSTTCAFQVKHTTPGGQEVTFCSLPLGVCPIQIQRQGPEGEKVIHCGQPHCVLVDWQVVETEKLPGDPARLFMTPSPVTVRPTTSIRTLARMLIDAHIHRIIVVDEEQRPVGMVSSTDLVAAVAYAEDEA